MPVSAHFVLLKLFAYVAADRRPALLSIMKTMLATYSHLLNALLMPPPTTSSGPTAQPEWVRRVDWINVMAQNLMAAANDLRPVQVRCILVAAVYVALTISL